MATRSLLIVALVWALIGLVVAFTMRRKGHDFSVWLTLGVALGPLSVPLAVERARFHGAYERPIRASPTPQHQGFDLLAGLDGSVESLDALKTAISLFGPSLSSLTISTVLDYDSRESPSGLEVQDEVQEMLDGIASGVGVDRVETRLLFGRPDQALAEYARTAGMELIVVGARGRGSSERVFGSVTGRIVGGSEIPVFVGPRGP